MNVRRYMGGPVKVQMPLCRCDYEKAPHHETVFPTTTCFYFSKLSSITAFKSVDINLLQHSLAFFPSTLR